MNELRWILLVAGLLVLLGIYLHGRRNRLASTEHSRTREVEPPQLTETSPVRRREPAPVISSYAANVAVDDLPEVRIDSPPASTVLSPEEALSTAALDRLTITQPLNVNSDAPNRPVARVAVEEPAPRINRPRPSATVPRGTRKIIALRVPAVTAGFNGAQLKDAFLALGLRHGRYGIFHRADAQGTPIFSVASIMEPGTFDLSTMDDQEYPGVSLFLQLPGPVDGLGAFDAMLDCARRLQRNFGGALQGERGKELSDDAIARMREEIADFLHLVQPTATDL